MAGARRLSELDALRGIAALAVVGYHYTTQYQNLFGHVRPPAFDLPAGRAGVQAFFAISGFVIFMTLDRTQRPLDFVVSRLSRLYPAYWAAMLLTTAIVWVAGFDALKVSALSFLADFTMMQGPLPGIQNVDGAYWTLTIELCFYACMFGLYLRRLLNRIEPILILWISLKWLWFAHPHWSQLAGYLLLEEHIPFFAIGICCYRLSVKMIDWRWAAAVLSFAICTVLYIDPIRHGVVAIGVTALLLSFPYGYASWLRTKLLVGLGAISYTLYLLHQNIGYTVIRNLESRGIGPNIAILVALGVSIGLATAMTMLIERPAMRWIRDRYRRAGQSISVRVSDDHIRV